jgi:2-desacetyl-2-hydroxyethyl bacteriochlorophyllide A dehydrogenase
MQSIVLINPGRLELVESAPPEVPALNEAQVRIHRVGICGTDLHAFAGHQPFFSYPRILGHELAAEVMAFGPMGAASNVKVGDLCAIRPYMNCGTCGACLRGFENACQNMQVLGVMRDGGMRELINVPIDHLHPSSVLTVDELALVEMLAIGAHAIERAHITPGEVALVIGLGPIGLGVSLFAHRAGAKVIAMDVSDTRLAFARQQPGIDHIIDGRQDVVEQLHSVHPLELPTVVFDATGNAQSMMNAFRYGAHGGRIVFVGLFQGDVTFNDPEFHRREMMLLASRNATRRDFKTVMDALESQQVDIRRLITHRAAPEQLIQEFSGWLEPQNGVIKAMLSFV